MQRISVHISEETKQRINLATKAKQKTEAEVIREALDEGLKKIHPSGKSAQALLDLGELTKQIPAKPGTPTDISENHDFYAWGGEKKSGC